MNYTSSLIVLLISGLIILLIMVVICFRLNNEYRKAAEKAREINSDPKNPSYAFVDCGGFKIDPSKKEKE